MPGQRANAIVIRHSEISLLLLLAAASYPAGADLLPYPVDDQAAPALSLSDLGGTQHSLSAYRGNVVLVNFWATWCAPCLIEMPGMQRLLSVMKGRPFTLLAVNVKEAKTTVWCFKNLLKVNFPALLDSDGAVTKAWEVQFYPTSFLIDSEGNIRSTACGMIDWDSDETRHLIEQLMPDSQAVIHKRMPEPEFIRTLNKE